MLKPSVSTPKMLPIQRFKCKENTSNNVPRLNLPKQPVKLESNYSTNRSAAEPKSVDKSNCSENP